MKKKLRKQKGITLVALVVTIIVLLILAGITIIYIMGENSIFNKASDAKIQIELAKIEERAQTIYSDKLLEYASNTLNTKVETSDVIEQLRNEGYTIEQRPVSVGDITGISLDKESITMGKNKIVEIKVTYEGVDDLFVYYVEVEGKYYQMHSNKGFVTIDREASNLTKSDFENSGEESTANLTVTSSDETVATAKVKEGSNKVIEITSTEKEAEVTITVTYGSYTKECKVKVIEPILATDISLNKTAYTVTGGDSWTNDLQLVATLKPDNVTEKEVTWKSSNLEIATVDNTGLVKAGTKGGDVTITATTKDGTNLSAECKITTELFSEIKTSTTLYTDSEGNTAQIPGDFAVGTSDNVNNVTGGLVIQDNEGNQFIWIPVGEIKKADGTKDTITLGRYTFDTTNGTPTLVQNADNYSAMINLRPSGYSYDFLELTRNSGNNAPAKSLSTFVTKTQTNGGYYFGRYEASEGGDNKAKSQYDKSAWRNITQLYASTYARSMYSSNYVESDLVNSYSWDTAIVFIQKYSGDTNYANRTLEYSSLLNTGMSGDKVCNIYSMASGCREWSTEHSTNPINLGSYPCVIRGNYANANLTPSYRESRSNISNDSSSSFRLLCYIK